MARANGNNAGDLAQPRRNVRRGHGQRPEPLGSRAMPGHRHLARVEYQHTGGIQMRKGRRRGLGVGSVRVLPINY